MIRPCRPKPGRATASAWTAKIESAHFSEPHRRRPAPGPTVIRMNDRSSRSGVGHHSADGSHDDYLRRIADAVERIADAIAGPVVVTAAEPLPIYPSSTGTSTAPRRLLNPTSSGPRARSTTPCAPTARPTTPAQPTRATRQRAWSTPTPPRAWTICVLRWPDTLATTNNRTIPWLRCRSGPGRTARARDAMPRPGSAAGPPRPVARVRRSMPQGGPTTPTSSGDGASRSLTARRQRPRALYDDQIHVATGQGGSHVWRDPPSRRTCGRARTTALTCDFASAISAFGGASRTSMVNRTCAKQNEPSVIHPDLGAPGRSQCARLASRDGATRGSGDSGRGAPDLSQRLPEQRSSLLLLFSVNMLPESCCLHTPDGRRGRASCLPLPVRRPRA